MDPGGALVPSPRDGDGPELLAARLGQQGEQQATPSERDRKVAEASRRGGDVLGDFLNSSSGRQLQREVVRGLFGMLKKAL